MEALLLSCVDIPGKIPSDFIAIAPDVCMKEPCTIRSAALPWDALAEVP